MISITEKHAFLYLSDLDRKVIDDELKALFNSVQRSKRHMTHKYFLEDDRTIALVVYWGDKEVERYRFQTAEKASR